MTKTKALKQSVSVKPILNKKGEESGMVNIYLKNVPLEYARVHEPREKYVPEGTPKPEVPAFQYELTTFVETAVREHLEDTALVNKQFFEVGKDKNKLRVIKFTLDDYGQYEGLHGTQLTCPAKTKDGKPRVVTVIDLQGEPVTEDLGNGTIAHLKLFGYRNKEGLLNISIDTVVVVELVEYTGGGGSGGVVEDDELGIKYVKKDSGASKTASEFEDDAPPFDTEDEPEY
jgi:hypothetical protein